MRIKYQPRSGANEEAIHLNTQTRWLPGEIKDIDPDAKVRLRIAGQSIYVSWIDDLLGNSDFVQADDETNPNVNCAMCGRESLETGYLEQFAPFRTIPFEVDGQHVCRACFQAANTPPPQEVT